MNPWAQNVNLCYRIFIFKVSVLKNKLKIKLSPVISLIVKAWWLMATLNFYNQYCFQKTSRPTRGLSSSDFSVDTYRSGYDQLCGTNSGRRKNRRWCEDRKNLKSWKTQISNRPKSSRKAWGRDNPNATQKGKSVHAIEFHKKSKRRQKRKWRTKYSYFYLSLSLTYSKNLWPLTL